MERIVFVTDGSENDHFLIELLKVFFRECEIQIISSNSDHTAEGPKGSSANFTKNRYERK